MTDSNYPIQIEDDISAARMVKKVYFSYLANGKELVGLMWWGLLGIIKIYINPRMPSKWQRKLAERRVIREIQRAYKDVPYYRNKYDDAGVDISSIHHLEDLKKLPFITKEEVRENFPKGIVADGVNIEKCHHSTTTGSSGKPLSFIFSKATFVFYILTSMRVYTMIGFRPWHKHNYIKWTDVKIPGLGFLPERSHIPSNISVEEQISRLRVSKPDLLVGYASCILEIARSISTEDKFHIRPKFISVNSETSTQGERDFISSVFNCPVYDEYSTEETWMISSQCRNHNYHLFTDNVWVEFLDEKGDEVATGETGEIVLTTMRSRAMPFIRYRIGDLGRPSDHACSCNCNFPLIESFEGRCDDSFILPSGKIISSMKILIALDPIVEKNINLVEEYKVIQKEKGLIVIQIVKGKNYCEEPFKEVRDKLYEIFGEPVDIVVEPLEKIPSKGIKRKAIESWVKKEEVK